MKVHDLKPAPGSNTRKRRVARGIGGKGGKTAEEVTPKGLLRAYRGDTGGRNVAPPVEVA